MKTKGARANLDLWPVAITGEGEEEVRLSFFVGDGGSALILFLVPANSGLKLERENSPAEGLRNAGRESAEHSKTTSGALGGALDHLEVLRAKMLSFNFSL